MIEAAFSAMNSSETLSIVASGYQLRTIASRNELTSESRSSRQTRSRVGACDTVNVVCTLSNSSQKASCKPALTVFIYHN